MERLPGSRVVEIAEAERKKIEEPKAGKWIWLMRWRHRHRVDDLGKRKLNELDTAAYKTAERVNTVDAFRKYQENWPDGQNFSLAGRRISELERPVPAASKPPSSSPDEIIRIPSISSGRGVSNSLRSMI